MMKRRANFNYAFLLFGFFCCFVISICSSLGINDNIKLPVSSSPENASESFFQSSEPVKKLSTDEMVKKIPPDKESELPLKIKPKSDSNMEENILTDTSANGNSDQLQGNIDQSKDLKSKDNATVPKEDSNHVDKKKETITPVDKDSHTEPSKNVEKPSVDVKVNEDFLQQQAQAHTTSDAPKKPEAKVFESKADNQSQTRVSREGGKGDGAATGTETPEDGSDVPTFDEYQRKFTGKRDGAGMEAKKGVKHEDATQGGSASTPHEKNGEATTPQPGNEAGIASVTRFKNVASTGCGAKIVANNNEATNPAHVLNENRDEYMNHPCTANKWFVIEACEPVRLRQVDIASYELFSSMLRTFRISASERFPQKLWDMVGTFTAKNEKGVQTYRVEQDKYYKYFKFEILDHHGNEHFCPLSLVRLYGVLVEDDDGDDEQPPEQTPEIDSGRNEAIPVSSEEDVNAKDQENGGSLFQSAKKVLVDIMTKTLQPKKPLEGKSELDTEKSIENSNSVTTTVPPPTNGGSSENERQEETRLSQLIKLLMYGEYSSLLKHCLELLQRSPRTLQEQLINNEYIPSPSMAYVECSKVAYSARLSSKDLRLAYLFFNNASLPWESEKRAFQIGVMGTVKQAVTPNSVSDSGTENGKQEEKISSRQNDNLVKADKILPLETEKLNVSEFSELSGSPKPDDRTSPQLVSSLPSVSPKVSENQKVTLDTVIGNTATETKTLENEAPFEKTRDGKSEKETSVHGANGSGVENAKTLPKVPMEIHSATGGIDKEAGVSSRQRNTENPEDYAKTEEEKQKGDQNLQKEQNGKDSSEKSSESPQVIQKEQQPTHTSSDSQKTSDVGEASEKPKLDDSVAKVAAQKGQDASQALPKVKVSDSTPGSNGRAMGIKENAYMRLSNKLRAMEVNVTMSMAYLEELSRSYKKKTDKISKSLEAALLKLEESVAVGEERAKFHQQQILGLEKQIEELRQELRMTDGTLRRDTTLMTHGILLQAATLNMILIVVNVLLTLYCSRRQRPTNDMGSAHFKATPNAVPCFLPPHSHLNGGVRPTVSNSDTNLYIVDPPFRLEEHAVKKHSSVFLLTDGKKKKKRKKNLPSHQGNNLQLNGFRDRSASESRIEDLM